MFDVLASPVALQNLRMGQVFVVARDGSQAEVQLRALLPRVRIRERAVLVKNTVQQAVDACVSERGDTILIAPDADGYDESVTVNKSNVTLIGLGNRGSAFIAPSANNTTAVTVSGVSDVTLVNVGCEGKGTGGGLHVSATARVRRVRAVGCKLEGGAFGARLQSTGVQSVGDTILDDCELAHTVTGLHLMVSGGGDPVTQTVLRNCFLHDFSSRGVWVDTVHTAELLLFDNTFSRKEDGTEPTNEYVLAAVANSSGHLARNGFPAAAATPKISVAAGVIRGGNFYTDGIAG